MGQSGRTRGDETLLQVFMAVKDLFFEQVEGSGEEVVRFS